MGKSKHKILPGWEYCECGCHGHSLEMGGLSFWLYNDLKGNYYLDYNHKHGERIGVYKSWEEADKKVREILKKHKAKVMKELKDI